VSERPRPRLRAGSAWALAGVAVTLPAGLLRTIVGARFLGPAEIGLLGIALLALAFVEAVASSGIDTALVAQRGDVEPHLDPAFTIQAVRGVLVFAALWIATPWIARTFHANNAVAVIRSVATIAVLRGVANPAVALAARRLAFQRVFWWSLPEALTSLAVTLVLAPRRRDVWALVFAVVAGQASGTLASYGIVPRRPRLAFRREAIAALLRFGRFVGGSRALMYFSVTADAAIVGLSMGTQTLGLYQFATRVAELPVVTFTRAVAQVALPAISGSQGSAMELRLVWRRLLEWVLAVNAAAALTIVASASIGVAALVGPNWIAAVPLMRVLAVAMVFRAVIVLVGQLLDGVGRPADTMRLNAWRLAALLVVLPLAALAATPRAVAIGVLAVNAAIAWVALRLAARRVADRSD
jgi:O-antigen/teichoic acid export membrane protein